MPGDVLRRSPSAMTSKCRWCAIRLTKKSVAGFDPSNRICLPSRPDAKGFVVLAKRWVVERTHAWNERARRLVRHHDRLASVPEAYLKLHLLSHRLVAPHGTNLDGTFGILPNVAWTSEGAIDLAKVLVDELNELGLAERTR